MFGLELIVALVSTVIIGTVIGRRYRVGPPVLLIFLGVLLGLIPHFAHIRVNGEIVLLLFLPAILYWEGLNTSFREIRANARIIVFLSVVLVIATAVAVSLASSMRMIFSTAAARASGVISGGSAFVAAATRSVADGICGYGRPSATLVIGSWPWPYRRAIPCSSTREPTSTPPPVAPLDDAPSPASPRPIHLPGGFPDSA